MKYLLTEIQVNTPALAEQHAAAPLYSFAAGVTYSEVLCGGVASIVAYL